MANPFFRFKQFTVFHDRCAMKVTTDACLFGAWCAEQLSGSSGTALDVGAGTGLLSLMLAQKTSMLIDAVEIDTGAALQAAENRSGAGFGNVRIITGDIRALQLPRYDVIISNPPFYERELESADKGKRTAHHSDGLTWTDLFAAIDRCLAPEGTAYLLLPAKRRKELEAHLKAGKFHLQRVVEVHPSMRQEATRLMLAFGRRPCGIQEERLTIADSTGYTARFVALLQEYYLYL